MSWREPYVSNKWLWLNERFDWWMLASGCCALQRLPTCPTTCTTVASCWDLLIGVRDPGCGESTTPQGFKAFPHLCLEKRRKTHSLPCIGLFKRMTTQPALFLNRFSWTFFTKFFWRNPWISCQLKPVSIKKPKSAKKANYLRGRFSRWGTPDVAHFESENEDLNIKESILPAFCLIGLEEYFLNIPWLYWSIKPFGFCDWRLNCPHSTLKFLETGLAPWNTRK